MASSSTARSSPGHVRPQPVGDRFNTAARQSNFAVEQPNGPAERKSLVPEPARARSTSSIHKRQLAICPATPGSAPPSNPRSPVTLPARLYRQQRQWFPGEAGANRSIARLAGASRHSPSTAPEELVAEYAATLDFQINLPSPPAAMLRSDGAVVAPDIDPIFCHLHRYVGARNITPGKESAVPPCRLGVRFQAKKRSPLSTSGRSRLWPNRGGLYPLQYRRPARAADAFFHRVRTLSSRTSRAQQPNGRPYGEALRTPLRCAARGFLRCLPGSSRLPPAVTHSAGRRCSSLSMVLHVAWEPRSHLGSPCGSESRATSAAGYDREAATSLAWARK